MAPTLQVLRRSIRFIRLPHSSGLFACPWLLAFLLIAHSFEPARAGEAANETGRPNVLFLFNDDQRADTIAALGNRLIQTPNLDRLCSRGVAFDRAYMQGAFGGATCVPSRAMLLSGKSLFHVDTQMLRHETWPMAFSRAGYVTFATGKWHNGEKSLVKSFPGARSIFAGGMTNPLKAPLASVVDGKLTERKVAPKHACEVFADEAIRFVRDHKAPAPFFCYVAFDGPHDPHIVPNEFPIRYEPNKDLLPANFLPQHPFDNGDMTLRDEVLLQHPRPAEAVQSMLADYYRYISYLDMQIGRILDALAASPQGKNTFVVFSADSGVARGSHGLIGKQNLYEHSVRVPLILAGPGIPAGKRTDAMCYLFDVLPTLGSLCAVKAPMESEGEDLTAVLRNPGQAGRRELVFAYRQVQRGIRDERWKLIRYPQVNKTQLFDLSTDPLEKSDLSAIPEQANRVKDLMARLAAAQRGYGDNCPLTVANPKPAEWSPPAKKQE